MIKKITTFIFLLLILNITAQKQSFYDFTYDYKFGVVDAQGNEVVEPKYDWKLYILKHESPFFVLMSETIDPIIVNSETGATESMKYITGAYTIDLEKSEFIYIHDGKDGFLMDNKDLNIRKKMTKKYDDVLQEKDYLIGKNNQIGKSDIIKKEDLSIVKSGLEVSDIESYRDDSDNLVYIVKNKKGTVFFDHNFKELFSTPAKLKDFNKISAYLKSKGIKIVREMEGGEVFEIGAGPDFPYIKISKEENKNEFICTIKKSLSESSDFFSFNPKEFKISQDRFNNQISLKRNEGNRVFTYLSFYIDVQNKVILFPKKYWNAIDLKEFNN